MEQSEIRDGLTPHLSACNILASRTKKQVQDKVRGLVRARASSNQISYYTSMHIKDFPSNTTSHIGLLLAY